MNTDNKIIPLFSTPVYYVDDVKYDLSDRENKCIESILTSPCKDDLIWLSNDIHVLENVDLLDVKKLCQEHLDTYIKEILHIKQDFYITNSWISVKHKNESHHPHCHQNSIFSGVFYVNANSKMSGLKLYGTQSYLKKFGFNYNYKEWNLFNSPMWNIPVKTGTMIIFPSHVQHSVDTHCEDERRIVIGFNSFVRGNFGMETKDYYCSQLRL